MPASFFIRAIFLRALLCMVLMWGGQVSFLSNVNPRYVGVSCWWISCPLICRMISSLLGDREKQVASVLVLLIITNHSFAQSEMRFIASCILIAAVVTCSALVHNARSSACGDHRMCEDSCSKMSSVEIMKRMGEMTPPCWAPSLIFIEELVCPSSLTRADLWNKKLWIHEYMLPQPLFLWSLKRSPSFHTLLKALARSTKTASVSIFCWKPFSVSWASSVTWCPVLLFFLKLVCSVSVTFSRTGRWSLPPSWV